MNPSRIKSVSHGAVTSDGSSMAFRVTTVSGEEIDLSLATADAQKFISYIVAMLQVGSTQHALTPTGSSSPPQTITATPIEARGIGIGQGRNETEQLIVIDLGPCQLTFAVPNLSNTIKGRAQ